MRRLAHAATVASLAALLSVVINEEYTEHIMTRCLVGFDSRGEQGLEITFPARTVRIRLREQLTQLCSRLRRTLAELSGHRHRVESVVDGQQRVELSRFTRPVGIGQRDGFAGADDATKVRREQRLQLVAALAIPPLGTASVEYAGDSPS